MGIYDIEGMGYSGSKVENTKEKEAKIHARTCANALLGREKNVEKMAATLREILQRDK